MLLGLSTSPSTFVTLRLVREGVRIEPSLIYDHPRDFADAIGHVAEGSLRPSVIVTGTVPFRDVSSAFTTASQGTSGTVHVLFE